MDDLLAEFLAETSESLAALDLALVRLEQTPGDKPTLALVFRLVHTIKGTCGFLGLPRLERLAHTAESVLVRVRDNEITATPALVSAVLHALDGIRSILAGLAAAGAEPAGDDAALIAELEQGAYAASTPPPASTTQATATHERPAAEPAADTASAGQTIRVEVGVLENLMTMVGELVLTRNQLLQLARGQKNPGVETEPFTAPLQRLSQITADLQEGVMKTRMQPIGQAWNKLPRLVRDLSHDLGKPILLELRGAETELDRQVLELIKDPITHMVRNCADHGLESLAARRAAGKPDAGTISLDAYHESGHIVIEIADDGAGLRLGRIRAQALAQGLTTHSALSAMDDASIMRFILQPGFSTADRVTSVSGRGVGMDVVRTNVERIGGIIEVASTAGRGSRFTLKIPLTLAIVAALIVETAGERFAMPQIGVIELVSVGNAHVERIDNAMVLRLRGRLVPLIRLHDVLALDPPVLRSGEPVAPDPIIPDPIIPDPIIPDPIIPDRIIPDPIIVVARIAAAMVGIVVDRVFDTEEIVVKPLAPILRGLSVFGGNTILGDGSVIMILDPGGVARAAGLHGRDIETRAAVAREIATSASLLPMLLVKAGGSLMVVPLSLVARLEQVPREKLERAGDRMVTQYRGRLMPLAPISGALDPARANQSVLVFSDTDRATGRDRAAGLVVDEIVDVIEDELRVQLASSRPGTLGTAIVAGLAVEVIDTGHWLTSVFPDWFLATNTAARPTPRLLVVEDSAFFRQMLVPVLAAEGYEVTAAADAAQAFALRDAGKLFDAIVSDIEMPGLSGLEFARAVRAGTTWRDTPMIALSGRITPNDVAAGREAGFIDYVEKFNRDTLTASLRRCLSSEQPPASAERPASGENPAMRPRGISAEALAA